MGRKYRSKHSVQETCVMFPARIYNNIVLIMNSAVVYISFYQSHECVFKMFKVGALEQIS